MQRKTPLTDLQEFEQRLDTIIETLSLMVEVYAERLPNECSVLRNVYEIVTTLQKEVQENES